MKGMADEAAWKKEHPPQPPKDEAEALQRQQQEIQKKEDIEKGYNSYLDRITKSGPRDINRKCLKDYSTICPQGFVAM